MASFMEISMLMVIIAVVAGRSSRLTMAETFRVGDAGGWTILGNPNYRTWAAEKFFYVGDVLWFDYQKDYHNVLKVSRADFKACSNSSALATYNSGNDSIPLDSAGHHYFICGRSNHCEYGQKVDMYAVPSSPSSIVPGQDTGAGFPAAFPGTVGALSASVAVFYFALLAF